jgi:hypothetical protein
MRSSDPPPSDQADGLRRLFGFAGTRFVAVVANPHVAFAGLALERLASACAMQLQGRRRVLVVDAACGDPQEIARLDLAAAIQTEVAPGLDYLAARGLPLRHVDARGSCESFLDALADAAPQAGAVIVHADPTDLARLFARREPRPLLLAADHPASVTAAYANMKQLAQRPGLLAFDLLLVAAAASPRAPRIAEKLGATAERFAGAVLHDWAAIDPALQRLAGALLAPTATPLAARADAALAAGWR